MTTSEYPVLHVLFGLHLFLYFFSVIVLRELSLVAPLPPASLLDTRLLIVHQLGERQDCPAAGSVPANPISRQSWCTFTSHKLTFPSKSLLASWSNI